jgi:hypothetical protein
LSQAFENKRIEGGECRPGRRNRGKSIDGTIDTVDRAKKTVPRAVDTIGRGHALLGEPVAAKQL